MKENIEEVIEYLDGIDIKIFLSGMAEQSNYIVGKANEVNEAVELLLSDYKRVLKENEELLREKIDNNKIIALAQNEFLGYEQGYQDGKASRRSATQAIIEGQQYYIISKQIERYKNQMEKLQKENEELKQSLIINKNLYEELCNKNNELKRDNELARQALKEQCDIVDERNQLLKENKDWQKAYQEEKDKQFELLRENQKLQKKNEELKEAVEIYKGQVETKIDAYIDSNYLSKQKIKDKIEELNKKEKQELKGTKGQDRYSIKQQYMYQRNVLQDLLEEKGE